MDIPSFLFSCVVIYHQYVHAFEGIFFKKIVKVVKRCK